MVNFANKMIIIPFVVCGINPPGNLPRLATSITSDTNHVIMVESCLQDRNQINFTQLGTSSADSITGTSGNDAIAAGAGDDMITANGGADVLYGGADNDIFVLNESNVTALTQAYGSGDNTDQLSRVDGGSGVDTISFSGSGISFDLRNVANQAAVNQTGSSRLNSIESFDLTGSGDNSLTLEPSDLRDLTGFNWLNASTAAGFGFSDGTYTLQAKESARQLLINGDSGDALTITNGAWTNNGTITDSSNTYNVYSSSSGLEQLLVDSQVSITATIA